MTGDESFAIAYYASAGLWAIGSFIYIIQCIMKDDRENLGIAIMYFLTSPVAMIPVFIALFIGMLWLLFGGLPAGIFWIKDRLKKKQL